MIYYKIHKWTNHLNSPNRKLCDKTENITHLYTDCKRTKIWKYFQKHYQTLTQKQKTSLQHILTISSLSLPPKTKKLTLTLTTKILTTYGKQEINYNLIIQSFPPLTWSQTSKTTWKALYQHTINNTLHEFQSNLCINNAISTLTQISMTMLF